MVVVKKHLIYVIISLLGLILLITGSMMYSSHSDRIESGIYFRRIYGFLGMRSDNSSVLELKAFNVGKQNTDFLMDTNHLSFGMEGIDVTHIHIENLNTFREVDYLHIIINIDMHIESAQITHLVSPTETFEIGIINLLRVNNSQIITSHAVRDIFVFDNLYSLGLGELNSQSFEIKKVMFQHDKIKKYDLELELPISYTSQTALTVNIIIDFEIHTFDIFVLRPVLSINLINHDEEHFFTPMLATKHELGMNYFEIKEYISHVKTERS